MPRYWFLVLWRSSMLVSFLSLSCLISCRYCVYACLFDGLFNVMPNSVIYSLVLLAWTPLVTSVWCVSPPSALGHNYSLPLRNHQRGSILWNTAMGVLAIHAFSVQAHWSIYRSLPPPTSNACGTWNVEHYPHLVWSHLCVRIWRGGLLRVSQVLGVNLPCYLAQGSLFLSKAKRAIF